MKKNYPRARGIREQVSQRGHAYIKHHAIDGFLLLTTSA